MDVQRKINASRSFKTELIIFCLALYLVMKFFVNDTAVCSKILFREFERVLKVSWRALTGRCSSLSLAQFASKYCSKNPKSSGNILESILFDRCSFQNMAQFAGKYCSKSRKEFRKISWCEHLIW